MRKAIVIAIALALAVCLSSEPSHCADAGALTLPAGAEVSQRVVGLPGLDNVGWVAPDILRGAQPEEEGYATLREMGVRTVVNLRSSNSEAEAVEAAGMRSVHIRMGLVRGINRETVERAVKAISDPENRPVYIHCAYGKDRTGVVVAVYRMEVEGWSYEDAEAEMQSFGFNDVWLNLKGLIRSYREKEDHVERDAFPGSGL
ncbi:MAG: tyrosine-protein phosphatase [Nitrospirota bacterium]|jgi:tyrosine-protein phosphatase SIW14